MLIPHNFATGLWHSAYFHLHITSREHTFFKETSPPVREIIFSCSFASICRLPGTTCDALSVLRPCAEIVYLGSRSEIGLLEANGPLCAQIKKYGMRFQQQRLMPTGALKATAASFLSFSLSFVIIHPFNDMCVRVLEFNDCRRNCVRCRAEKAAMLNSGSAR